MTKAYRVTFESYDKKNPNAITKTILIEDDINKPSSLLDFSMGLDKQIALIKSTQDCLLPEKLHLLTTDIVCSCCGGKLKKAGTLLSTFHDVFTDHQVKMQRLRCTKCDHEEPSTIRTTFNGVQSAELMKIQSELGATHTFRESEQILTLFSNKDRQINNHDRVKQVVEKISKELENIDQETLETILTTPASELILNIDGGHLKTTEPDKRSIEAMTAVVYRPEALETNKQETRNHITSKHCAASVKDDGQAQLITNTIIAALKQGLTDKTHITALCDGAENCWKVVAALKPLAGSITCILDWFHLSMKIQNIALTDENKNKLIRIKWHLWRGNVDRACTRLMQLIDIVPEQHKDRLKNF